MKDKIIHWIGIISMWFIIIYAANWAINTWSDYFKFEPISIWHCVSIFVLLFISIFVVKTLIKS